MWGRLGKGHILGLLLPCEGTSRLNIEQVFVNEAGPRSGFGDPRGAGR
jgi:hypothetical protein